VNKAQSELKKTIGVKQLMHYLNIIIGVLVIIQSCSANAQNTEFQDNSLALKAELVEFQREENSILRSVEVILHNITYITSDTTVLDDDAMVNINVACDYIENHPEAFEYNPKPLVGACEAIVDNTMKEINLVVE